jgi:hypothetical protein
MVSHRKNVSGTFVRFRDDKNNNDIVEIDDNEDKRSSLTLMSATRGKVESG